MDRRVGFYGSTIGGLAEALRALEALDEVVLQRTTARLRRGRRGGPSQALSQRVVYKGAYCSVRDWTHTPVSVKTVTSTVLVPFGRGGPGPTSTLVTLTVP